MADDVNARVATAISYAVRYGGIDGGHHKQWVIDQMVRALTGCPVLVIDQAHGDETQGESEEYMKLVAGARAGEDGPETYDWDTGVAP